MRKLTKREKYLIKIITIELTEIAQERDLIIRPDQYDRERSYFLGGYESALKLILDLIQED